MEEKFIHFRIQSSYSLLESALKIGDIINIAEKHSVDILALSERDNLYSSLEFALAAQKASIKPIHGAILNLQYKLPDKVSNVVDLDDQIGEVLLLAKTHDGYKNILSLVNKVNLSPKENRFITFDDLEDHNQDVILLSAYTDGLIGKKLIKDDYQGAKQIAEKLYTLFDDRFYFEIMRHHLKIEKKIEQIYIKLAKELNIPLIATNKVLFRDAAMYDVYDIFLCIAEGTVQDNMDRKRASNQCYFKTSQEMIELFSDLPAAIENTVELAKRCNFMLEAKDPELPKFASNSEEERKLLRQESYNGLVARLSIKNDSGNIESNKNKIISEDNVVTDNSDSQLNKNVNNNDLVKKDITDLYPEYFERLQYELDVICRMNFAGYFLIVSDFIKWSKVNKITVGPGRGSGAGSIVAWALEITDLDPIDFGLLFERFLNPDRVSMPDFDIDFCQERRDDVIKYVQGKYGRQFVGQIITFGKMQAKAVIKDVARVLQLPHKVAEYITTLVPFSAVNPVTLSQAIDRVEELSDAYSGNGLYNMDADPKLVSQVLNAALQLEGLHRHTSTHAAGIVIANCDLSSIVPITFDQNTDLLTVCYSMKYCELMGLVKFDFLGLQTLTVITKTIEEISKSDIKIELDKLDYDDSKTFELLSKGAGTGVFQFESIGMQNSLRLLKPDNVNDIIALGALYRPGPMENIPVYNARKHGLQEVDYLHPTLKPVLEPTYGVIIYQEQVMEIAKRLAGYSLAEADLLRRAMGKKVKAEMDAQEAIFVDGASKNNISKKQAKSIFDIVAKFAGYGFNKSHASAYGAISYYTAYLKANFAAEFFVASINLNIDDSDKIRLFIQDVKDFGINILPPSVNQSEGLFTIKISEFDNKKSIIFGIGAIKNATVKLGDAIAKERNCNGVFKNIVDFLERIDQSLFNRRSIEYLIYAGCFAELHDNDVCLISSIPKLLLHAELHHKESNSIQMNMLASETDFDYLLSKKISVDYVDDSYKEFDAVGLFLRDHPIKYYQKFLHAINIGHCDNFDNLSYGSHLVKLAGVIVKKDSRMSKRGRFIILSLSSIDRCFEITIYDDNVLKDFAEFLRVKQCVLVTCNLIYNESNMQLIATRFESILDIVTNKCYITELKIDNVETLDIILKFINKKSLISSDKGEGAKLESIATIFLFKLPYYKAYALVDLNNDIYHLSLDDYMYIISIQGISYIIDSKEE